MLPTRCVVAPTLFAEWTDGWCECQWRRRQQPAAGDLPTIEIGTAFDELRTLADQLPDIRAVAPHSRSSATVACRTTVRHDPRWTKDYSRNVTATLPSFVATTALVQSFIH